MKNKLMKIEIVVATVLMSIFLGCGDGDDSASLKNKPSLSANFVEAGSTSISYKSVPLSGDLGNDGKFEYHSSDKTDFYIGEFKFGSVTTINEDGLVFLQDIMGVDRVDGMKDQSVANLSRILLAVNNNSMDENQTKLLNEFDIVNSPEANVTALFVTLGLADVNQTYALNHVEYYYKLIKKAPITTTNLSYITKSLKMEIDTTSVSDLLANSDKLNNVDVYMDGIYQGRIEKDLNSSKFSLQIELIDNLNRARNFDITFKTDQTRTDTINYESPKFTITVPSPMQGRWIDSQTREVVYLKDENQLSGLSFTRVDGIMDINQLTDANHPGRYLLRAGLGDVNLYGTIKRASRDSNVAFKNIEMRVINVDANITEQYTLVLADANNSAAKVYSDENGSNTLYVDGNSTHYIFPKNIDSKIKDIRAITGQVKIWLREFDANSSKTSEFVIDNIVGTTFDVGTLNLTDDTLDYNLISRFKEGNDYLYYGYDPLNIDDKPITYSKTIEVCNNGNENISAATITVTNDMPTLFQTFSVSPVLGEITKGTCKDIPLEFSFHKPLLATDFNISVNVNSLGVDWSDHKRLTLSNETFIRLNFTSVDGTLNGFVIDDKSAWYDKTIISQDGSSFIILPRLASKAYKIAVAPQSANSEEAFLVGTDAIPNKKDLELYLGADDNELFNNIYIESVKGYDTLALRYGDVKAYISYKDIDYFTLDSLPAVTAKYTTYKVDSNISTKTDIVIPFYLNIDTTTLSNIKVYDDTDVEVSGITPTFNTNSKTVTLSSATVFDTSKVYTLKVEAGLKGAEDTNATLLKNIEWSIDFKATNLVSSGQEGDFGVSIVQVRDNIDNIVTDINTRLIWQDNNDTRSITKEYNEAKNYCRDLVTPYSSEWRLPTRNELLTLVDYAKVAPSMSDSFRYTIADGKYWTSTIKYGDTSSAWLVAFGNGTTSSVDNVNSKENVRCVIDSVDTNGSNFYLNSSYIKPTGTYEASDFVTDTNGTYLLIQDDIDAGTLTYTYEEAKSYCEALVLNDGSNNYFSDWRLPTIKELTTIIDDTVGTSTTPAIDTHFENVKASAGSRYWSVTSDASNVDKAWAISFEYGTHELDLKSNSNYIRCVSRGSL